MLKFLIILSVSIIICQTVTDIHEEGRVSGGQDAKLGQFPWQAAIHHKTAYRCLGALINVDHVLTIKDCVSSEEVTNGEVNVHLGVLIAANETSMVNVKEYKEDTPTDLIMLKIDNIDFDLNIHAINVITHDIMENTLAQASGWGYDNTKIYQILQFVYLNVTMVANIITSSIKPNHACQWDAGTGLVVVEPSTLSPLLIGIAKLNSETCADNKPSEYISTVGISVLIN